MGLSRYKNMEPHASPRRRRRAADVPSATDARAGLDIVRLCRASRQSRTRRSRGEPAVGKRYRNIIMDMNAGVMSRFAAVIFSPKAWVMNQVPTPAKLSTLDLTWWRGAALCVL